MKQPQGKTNDGYSHFENAIVKAVAVVLIIGIIALIQYVK